MDSLAIVSQLGFTMAGSILFCLLIGYFLDKWMGTGGIFIVIFIFLGVIGGGVTVFRQIEQVVDIKDKKSQPAGKKGNGKH